MRFLTFNSHDDLVLTQDEITPSRRYAILSHTWGDDSDEVTFDDVEKKSGKNKRGYPKLRFCATQASNDGLEYCWIDTCCINKKNSAELDEAINSMHKWYSEADVCYVYLSDVHDNAGLEKSRWFTRGWTLQELLAPRKLHFFNCWGKRIASRQDLLHKLEGITSIPSAAISDFRSTNYCVAQKMSWAAHRGTTRLEDRAYSLLGIFNVCMPLHYGEGSKAFQRLQEEIMRISPDMSIFLWQGQSCGEIAMLATSPSCFANTHECLKDLRLQKVFDSRKGWTLNNAVVNLELSIRPHVLTSDLTGIFVAYLQDPGLTVSGMNMGIFLEKEDRHLHNHHYRRVELNGEMYVNMPNDRNQPLPWPMKMLCPVMVSRQAFEKHDTSNHHSLSINFKTDSRVRCSARCRPLGARDSALHEWTHMEKRQHDSEGYACTVECTDAQGIIIYLLISLFDGVDILVCLGFDPFFEPLCVIVPLCGLVYGELSSRHIIHACSDLLLDQSQCEAYDPDSGIIALRGSGGTLEYSSNELGLEIELSDWPSPIESALIRFSAGNLIRSLIPGIDSPGCGVSARIVLDQVHKIALDRLVPQRARLCLGR